MKEFSTKDTKGGKRSGRQRSEVRLKIVDC
jgi:hypothetical protein